MTECGYLLNTVQVLLKGGYTMLYILMW